MSSPSNLLLLLLLCPDQHVILVGGQDNFSKKQGLFSGSTKGVELPFGGNLSDHISDCLLQEEI